MKNLNHYLSAAILGFISSISHAAELDLAKSPLFIAQPAPPLTMLIMGKNHKLFYEAYNDASDLNGDGILDVGYKPSIDYFGYFDSYKCYLYESSKSRFQPSHVTNNKKCSGYWSGDFLNYMTTSRIDALRKVLYGGYRYKENNNSTILERAYIPQDAHSWGKEYTSVAVDGYNISEYTPLNLPQNGKRHLFANTTLLNGNGEPLLRVAQNLSYRVWEWLSIERPVAGNRVQHGGNGPSIANSITDYVVRVQVCKTNSPEASCRVYANGKYRPTGLLQTFGETGIMKFGLLTGSYTKNLSGGVLRKPVSLLSDEIDANDGKFTSINGIIKTLDKLRIPNFGGSYMHESNCGFIFKRAPNEGECRSWGNPLAEQLYEGTRYFAGKKSPTSVFDTNSGDDAVLGLAHPNWDDPYANNPWCAKPNFLVISDLNPSFDSDQVPGSAFSSFSGDISMNASQLGQSIWTQEFGAGSALKFIGQAGSNNDGTPSAKFVSSFGNIRGLPEEPNKNGSYYSASVTYWAKTNDVHSIQGEQNIHSHVLALASPLPEINIPVSGKIITLVPFAKSVGGGSIDATEGKFQPTNTIVDFYVQQLTPTTGTFRINFEDTGQGADHDMDAIVQYHYEVNANGTITITLTSEYAAGSVKQHMGYVISGTTTDGTYLEVRDKDTSAGSDVNYFLDTPPGELPGGNWNTGNALPLTTSRTFTPGSSSSTVMLKSPLWYAAKYGGFFDKNNNSKPDLASEFDKDNDTVPDNYFLVTNALYLKDQLKKAFQSILDRNSSAAPVALNYFTLNSDSKIYQPLFNSSNWSGQLLAFDLNPTTGEIDATGSGPNGSQWDAGAEMTALNPSTERKIITYNAVSKKGVALRWPQLPNTPSINELESYQITWLNTNPDTNAIDNLGEKRLNYLRGDRTQEEKNSGPFRTRDNIMGDIIHSEPQYLAVSTQNLPDFWGNNANENNHSYSAFKYSTLQRKPALFMGSNDGMMHSIDAQTGKTLFSYMPRSIFHKVHRLTSPNYQHDYYVDGTPSISDAYFNSQWQTVLVGGLRGGGQGIYALDVTDVTKNIETNAANVALWEFTDANDADLGLTYSKPLIARMANGQWAAIFGNGYNNTAQDSHTSTTGNAVLYVVDLQTGALIKKFDTGVGLAQDPLNQSRPNGLSTPTILDSNGDHIADAIYAGDLFGNVWKINVNGSDVTAWGFAHVSGSAPAPLFTAKDSANKRQPITSAVNLKRVNLTSSKHIITFGTGKYIENSDKANLDTQTFYAVIDDGTLSVSGRSDLLKQTITDEVVVTFNNKTDTYRITSKNTLTSSHKGWYMDMQYGSNATGERIINRPIIRGNKVIFTTMISSSDVCAGGGDSWLMELDLISGARLAASPFDVNGDGVFNASDLIQSGGTNLPASGQKSTVGLIANPAIINADGKEYKYLSGSSGNIQTITENPGNYGRESWQQLR